MYRLEGLGFFYRLDGGWGVRVPCPWLDGGWGVRVPCPDQKLKCLT